LYEEWVKKEFGDGVAMKMLMFFKIHSLMLVTSHLLVLPRMNNLVLM
jgi:hypothetical protein